jgi:hypothetical protein
MPGQPLRLSMKLGWYLFRQKLRGLGYEGSAVHEAVATPVALAELAWRSVRPSVGGRKGLAR